jgi:class 3 adenylate cyclase/predicted ATPase
MSTFDEVLAQVVELLQRERRVSYRALKRRFTLDDEYIDDLKDELIEAKQWAADEGGKVLVWIGTSPVPSSRFQVSSSQPPALSTQHPDAGPQTLDARRSDAERRQLTVMFCDLVGSTVLSTQLDPEELREVVRAYQETCTEVIRRYDGQIAQHLGDGLLVYFGYPAAHEDDAQRAVRAALAIVGAIRESPLLNTQLQHPIQVRIGIHTGLVVIGEIGSSDKREILALGETPNIAARVQGQAAPDEVVISAVTYHLVEGLFECEDRGCPALKGVATPLTLYRVIKEGEAQSRFQVVVRKGLTPLVGREHEHGLLCERWERVKDGEGQVVLLSGEPGIGKSRLVEALKDTVMREGAPCLELHCSPYAQNSALYPVIAHVQRILHFQADETPENKLEKLQRTLNRAHFPQADTLPLLAALLSLPQPADCPPLALSPQRQKEKTHEALVAWLREEAKQQAVTYVWEDLHWADPSTLDLLTLFLAQVPTRRLLAVLTFRPEFTPPWGTYSYLSQLTLSRLGRSHVAMMVERVTGGKALPVEVVQQIANKTDGVPLFVEELTKMVMESGLVREVDGNYELSGPLPPLAIPSTLHDSLMARLDRLATVRDIAQVGATIGREFDYALLQAVSPFDENTLQRGLKQLVEAELVYQSGVLPQARYLFKHALVQDAAYQSLLKSRRQQLHQQVAQVLAEQFPETVATQPELVAQHYTAAGLIAQAIPYWQQAGQRASQRGANAEAVSHLTTGLELLKTLPDTPARTRQELSLQLALGGLLTATKGFAAPEVERAYTHARELCEQIGDREQVFTALRGLTLYYSMRLEHKTACALADQMLDIAQEAQDSGLLIEAYHRQGATRLWIGEFLAARTHLEQAIALYDPQRHRTHALRYGADPGVACRLIALQVLWILGYPDQALRRAQEAFTLAQEFSHVNTLGYGLSSMAYIYHARGEWQAAQEWAEACIAFATEVGLPYFVAQNSIKLGSALAAQGHHEEGITKMRQGLAAQRATGGQGLQQLWLALQVEAYIETGQIEEGWTALEEALTIRPKYGERYWEADLYRLKGALLLAQQDRLNAVAQDQRPSGTIAAAAEACFQQAIDTARELSAKSFELRAATSLARLWQQQGKRQEAQALLAEIYGWFTEGFDTKDLQEAKVLLQELA